MVQNAYQKINNICCTVLETTRSPFRFQQSQKSGSKATIQNWRVGSSKCSLLLRWLIVPQRVQLQMPFSSAQQTVAVGSIQTAINAKILRKEVREQAIVRAIHRIHEVSVHRLV